MPYKIAAAARHYAAAAFLRQSFDASLIALLI